MITYIYNSNNAMKILSKILANKTKNLFLHN